LLFDKDNHVNKHADEYIFSTEGHIFPIIPKLRTKSWEEEPKKRNREVESVVVAKQENVTNYVGCDIVNEERHYFLPLERRYFSQIHAALGLDD